jgi:hypothetical protein
MDDNVIAVFCGCYCWQEPRDEPLDMPPMEPDDDWEEY